MTAREQTIRARSGMLALAGQLQNISAACKRAGISRSHFYEIKAAFEKYGRDGLAPQERRRPRGCRTRRRPSWSRGSSR